jgi:hypothetical protein
LFPTSRVSSISWRASSQISMISFGSPEIMTPEPPPS